MLKQRSKGRNTGISFEDFAIADCKCNLFYCQIRCGKERFCMAETTLLDILCNGAAMMQLIIMSWNQCIRLKKI